MVRRDSCDDATSPNPLGRHGADVGRLRTRGRRLKIATWNVRTLHKPGQYENLKAEMAALDLDIIGIAETRWIDDGRISDGEYEMLYS